MTDSIASSCSASARFAPIAAGEVQGAAIVDNPLRRLSTIAEASQEEEEAAAVATGSAGGAAADLISLGMAAAAATLASMRRPTEAPPAQERQRGRGGFRRPDWAALGDPTPPNPPVRTESGLQPLICTRTTLVQYWDESVCC